ncbi:capsule assembly Wzi family protein [Dyadobacter sp. CY351]|uniref:capsule assembly Wzi family protein n=1 Tax=Dyadobacter sp. CY351 TaxID=2909337 RepID=UPI001F162E60|nr:capsule assembly Wzi family protein [Dyadobacter sp. CY351]MCF2518441.1 capsule assembly Wzi family protein [Dyadobacter sp. CY351]
MIKLPLTLVLLCACSDMVSALPAQMQADHLDPQTPDTTVSTSDKQFRFGLAAIASATSNNQVPFWMRSNQAGSMPLQGPSISFIGDIGRDYSKVRKGKLADWGVYLEPRLNIGKGSQLLLIETYAKGRLGIFQLKAGRSRDIMGLVDSTLSSGAFSISGNSLGIPKVELSIPEFWDLPLLKGVIAVKGNFAHGWLGNVDVKNVDVNEVKTYFHQKSFYARFGKPSWKLKLFAGFNHQVFWGNEREINGQKFKLSPSETYKYVIFGKGYGGPGMGIPRSKIGNHLGSIDQAVEFTTKSKKILVYHQFLYDVGGLYHLNNVKDGLFGISVANKETDPSAFFQLNKIVFEYLNTKSQGGEIDAKITPSGDEDYYNNFIYTKGWTYKGENLGNPLLTSRKYARKDLPVYLQEYFINNRISAFHVSAETAVRDWSIVVKAAYSLNYGTYGTSPWGHSLSSIRIPSKPPYFQEERQLSTFLSASKKMRQNMTLTFAVALDNGSLLYNSTGGSVKLSKQW